MNKVNYYIVTTKLNQLPEAVFRSKAWADRFIESQQKVWVNAKFKVYEVSELAVPTATIWNKLHSLFTHQP